MVGFESGGAAPLCRFIYKKTKDLIFVTHFDILHWHLLSTWSQWFHSYRGPAHNRLNDLIHIVVQYTIVSRTTVPKQSTCYDCISDRNEHLISTGTYGSTNIWQFSCVYFADIPGHYFRDRIKRVFSLCWCQRHIQHWLWKRDLKNDIFNLK